MWLRVVVVRQEHFQLLKVYSLNYLNQDQSLKIGSFQNEIIGTPLSLSNIIKIVCLNRIIYLIKIKNISKFQVSFAEKVS